MAANEKEKHQKLFLEDGFYFLRQKKSKEEVGGKSPFCRKRRFQHTWQQITETPSGIWAAFTNSNSYRPPDSVEGGTEQVEEMKAEWFKTYEATTNQGAADSLQGGFHVC